MPATTPMQYSDVSAPLVAVVALVVIVLICRWVFATGHRDERTARRLARERSRGDYGLLVPIASVRTSEDAELLREVLRDAHIRATASPTASSGASPAQWVVLVFRADADRARSLVSS